MGVDDIIVSAMEMKVIPEGYIKGDSPNNTIFRKINERQNYS